MLEKNDVQRSRSPRWSVSGYARMLLTAWLVLEFDSHRREILTNLANIQYPMNQLQGAPSSVDRYNSTRVDEGRRD